MAVASVIALLGPKTSQLTCCFLCRGLPAAMQVLEMLSSMSRLGSGCCCSSSLRLARHGSRTPSNRQQVALLLITACLVAFDTIIMAASAGEAKSAQALVRIGAATDYASSSRRSAVFPARHEAPETRAMTPQSELPITRSPLIVLTSAAVLSDVSFVKNSAFFGGAMMAHESNVTAADCLFAGNVALVRGGAVHMTVAVLLANCRLVVSHTAFLYNGILESGQNCLGCGAGGVAGGAVYAVNKGDGSTLQASIVNSTFLSNTVNATNQPGGGALFLEGNVKTVVSSDTFFVHNRVNGSGGAILLRDVSAAEVSGMFWNNSARLGGSDISASFENQLTLNGSNIAVGSTSVQWDRLAPAGCVAGEVGDLTGVCRRCGASTFSLDPYKASCDPCPENANCTGGMDVTPLKGLWHSGINSSFIHACPQRSSCGDAGNCTEVRCTSIQLYVTPAAAAALGWL
jgi:hypothetical protein